MEYVTFDPKIHDTNKIATFIYASDFRTFDKLFSSKDKAVSTIEKSLKKDECIKVIYDDGNVIGMLRIYSHDKKSKTYFNSIKLLIVDVWDYLVICDIKEDDLYIAEIITLLLFLVQNKYKRVILDADFRNTKAKELYERLGFKVFNEKSFLKRGMYNMEFKLS